MIQDVSNPVGQFIECENLMNNMLQTMKEQYLNNTEVNKASETSGKVHLYIIPEPDQSTHG